MDTIRVTKAQKIKAIMDNLPHDLHVVFEGNDERSPYLLDYEEAVSFLNKELETLSNKSSGERKETETQKRNRELRQVILDYFGDHPTIAMTVTEMANTIPELAGFSTSKMTGVIKPISPASEKNPNGTGELVFTMTKKGEKKFHLPELNLADNS